MGKKALGTGHRALGGKDLVLLGFSGGFGARRVLAACVGLALAACPALMSGCAGGGSGGVKRAKGAVSGLGGPASSSVAERVETRLGPVERIEVLVLPKGTVIGGGEDRESGADRGAGNGGGVNGGGVNGGGAR